MGPSAEPRRGRTSRLLLALGVPIVAFHVVAAVVVAQMVVRAPSGDGDAPTLPWAVATVATAVLASALLVAGFVFVRNRRSETNPASASPADTPAEAGAVGDQVISTLRSMHTERRAARTVLVAFIESIPDAVVVAERDDAGRLRIRHVNRAAADLAGVAPDTLVGAAVDSILPETAGPKGVLSRLDAHGRAAGCESKFVARDGRTREVRLSASRIDSPSAAGEAPASYVLVVSDLGDTRRGERRRIATYRLSELVQDAESPKELLRGVESVLRGAARVDAFHFVAVDQASNRPVVTHSSDTRTAGVSIHEVTKGLSGYVLAHEAAVILNAEQIRHLVSLGEVKAAEPVAESWASAPVRLTPGVRGVLVIQNHDPSQPFQSADVDLLAFAAEQVAAWFRRTKAELERKRLSTAVEQAVDAVLLLDAEGRVEYVNPAFERQSGLTRDEVAGRALEDLWRPEDHEVPVAAIWETVRSGRPWTGATSCARKEGDPFRVEVTISAVLDDEGRVTEHIVVQHDVSHEVALEEQLRQAQKMEAVGILAGGVAHDFNNLLSVIQGYGELARSTLQDEETVAWLDQVLSASRRASTLIGQLLAFSRRQVIEPKPLDLSAVVLDLEKMIERLIGEDIRLTVETHVDLDLVEADPHKIDQVLMNLAVNARDAMPRGGNLTIRTDIEEIDAERAQSMPGLEPGTHVVLVVADTGVGMSPAVMKRIFEPFYTTKPKGQGTGLGLSTVYGIVNQAGGHVAVHSVEGRGTEFRIYLPSIGRAAAPAREDDEAEGSTTGTETIFVVEDEAALRGFVERVLLRQGYQVLTAANGDQGLEIGRAHDGAIDLLLTDVVMPGMNGSSLAATLLEDRTKMAVLFMSGYPDASIASYGVLDPDVDLLQKPFTSAQLLKRVRRALDAKSKALHSARRRLAPMA